MPIPKPKKGESQNDYMGRCMHVLRDEDRPQDQKVAICLSTYRDHSKSDMLDALNRVAEKFNPSHDERGRFTSGGGSTVAGGGAGGSRGRGSVVLSRFQPYTPDWQDHWAKRSEAIGAVATLMIAALPLALVAIGVRKGLNYIAAAIKKIRGKQGTDIESLIEELQSMSQDEQGQVLDEVLGGLSDADAEAVVAAMNNKSAKFNPNHDDRGRFSSGGGGGGSGGGTGGGGTGGASSAGGHGRRWEFIVDGPDKPEPLTSKWAEAWKSVSEHLGRLAVTFIRTFGTSLMAIIARKGASYVARALGIIGSSQDKATTNVTAQELLARAQALSDNDRGDLVNELLSGLSDEDAAAINAMLEGKTMSYSIETKDFNFAVQGLTDAGSFEGYASTFGNVDSGGDKMVPGAFAKSLADHKENGTAPLMLWAHDPRSPIGTWSDVKEDQTGLYVKGKLLIGQNVPDADRVHALLKAKAVRGLSFGYRVIDAEDEGDVRVLKSVELPEVSIVSFPMNTRAHVASVKSYADEYELVKRFKDFARDLRDGEPQPIKNLEDLLREVGIPKRMATHIVSVGYAKAIRSESGGDEAKQLLARLEAAAGAFQP